MNNFSHLRYPIGQFDRPKEYDYQQVQKSINTIEALPTNLENVLKSLDEKHYSKVYREDGWNLCQLVHHLADSHTHAYLRCKRTVINGDKSEVFGYNEQKWAELEDSTQFPVDDSLMILKGIHKRWSRFLRSLQKDDFMLSYFHLGYKESYQLYEVVALYAWHSQHHLAHIEIIANK